MSDPKITKVDLVVFEHKIENMGSDYNGFNQMYEEGSVMTTRPSILRIHTDAGVTGEYLAGPVERTAHALDTVGRYLIGKNPLERKKAYNDLRRGPRHTDRTAIGMVDVALWDLAGKLYETPIYWLLWGYKKSLPAYASTYHGYENGGLSTPEAFADFSEQCDSLGFRAFKIHGWGDAPIEREIANVHAVGMARGRQDGPYARPGLRVRDLGRSPEGRQGLRRRALLLARRPL